MRDVGRAISGVQDVKQAAWIQGKRAIIVDIHKQPGSNVVDTVDELRRLLPALERTLPAAVQAQVVNDRTQTIRASLRDVQRTLLLTVALVVLVVYLFLRGVWATLIPATAIPLSIAGTLGVMSVLGYSIDNLSLTGLTIAVGFVVDDAIVVIENIIRHVEAGEARRRRSSLSASSFAAKHRRRPPLRGLTHRHPPQQRPTDRRGGPNGMDAPTRTASKCQGEVSATP